MSSNSDPTTATKAFPFTVLASDSVTEARVGVLRTPHGDIETPVFMPVGTHATVKGASAEILEEIGASIILGNTYHLMLRPGEETVAGLGGLHGFAGWNRPILTDSGGFQVFSLAGMRKLDERGVEFRSHLDGSRQFLSPERSMEVQSRLGADICMVFDECPPHPIDEAGARKSMELTVRWAGRSAAAFEIERDRRASECLSRQALFGIVQGSVFGDLRRECLDRLVDIGFDGYAIGGLSVGEPKEAMYRVTEELAPRMPASHPRYLMGVGTPEDIVESVARGIDMFDCVLPTRSGRTGQAFTWDGPINIRNAKFAEDQAPIDPDSPTAPWSKAYLHHLVRSGEILGAMLMTEHNLWFYQRLMQELRAAIEEQRLTAFADAFRARYRKD